MRGLTGQRDSLRIFCCEAGERSAILCARNRASDQSVGPLKWASPTSFVVSPDRLATFHARATERCDVTVSVGRREVPMKSEFLAAITQLSSEKGVPKEMVLEALKAALVSAYKRNFDSPANLLEAELRPDEPQERSIAIIRKA